ncbi:MAG: iron ABC transporter permease, partial [Deltaproteobacteria bacterium]
MRHLRVRDLVGYNLLFLLLLGVTLLAALSTGPTGVGFSTLVGALQGEVTPMERAILLRIRLPRVLLAGIAGGALSLSGAAFQALLRNPLAGPCLLGVTGGGALGGVIALVAGLDRLGFWPIPLVAFLGATLSMFLIYAVATERGRLDPTRLLLSGVIFNALSSAVVMLISAIVSAEKLQEIIFWLMGSLAVPREPVIVVVVGGYVLGGVLLLLPRARDFDLLSLGESDARQLGVQVERTRTIAFFSAALMTGAVVSVSGMIGFVGLAVPHIVRRLFGADHRLLFPLTLTGGA